MNVIKRPLGALRVHQTNVARCKMRYELFLTFSFLDDAHIMYSGTIDFVRPEAPLHPETARLQHLLRFQVERPAPGR